MIAVDKMILGIYEKLPAVGEKPAAGEKHDDSLVLPFDRRKKSRLRVVLESGDEAALILERGSVLRGGDRLLADDGRIVKVEAALEPVLYVTAGSPQQLARAAYHLGNRHVPLQVGDCWLLLEQDHVLQEMLLGLGVSVFEKLSPFEPEAGAYGGGHHHHADDDAPLIQTPRKMFSHA
jgi:urease accessory protein